MLLSSVDHKHYLHSQTFIFTETQTYITRHRLYYTFPSQLSDRLKVHNSESIVYVIDAEHAKNIAKFQTHNNNPQILSARTI